MSLLEVTHPEVQSKVKNGTSDEVFIKRPSSGYTGESTFLSPASSKQLPPSTHLQLLARKTKNSLTWWLAFQTCHYFKNQQSQGKPGRCCQLRYSQLQIKPDDTIFLPSDTVTWGDISASVSPFHLGASFLARLLQHFIAW